MKLSKKQAIKVFEIAKKYKEKSEVLDKGLSVFDGQILIALEDSLLEGLLAIDIDFYHTLTGYLYHTVSSITVNDERYVRSKGESEFLRYLKNNYS